MKYFYILLCAALCACNGQGKQTGENTPNANDSTNTQSSQQMGIAPISMGTPGYPVHFKEFSVRVDSTVLFHYKNDSSFVYANNADMAIDVGEDLVNKNLLFVSKDYRLESIEFWYQTTLSISKEGPHCDLFNWKHYTSDPVKLSIQKATLSRIPDVSVEERTKFPKYTEEELKKAIKAECDPEWANLPIGEGRGGNVFVGISHYFLKVTAVHSQSGEKVVKQLSFELAMGC